MSCIHSNVDYAWSHGNLGRCKNCGAVEDDFNGGWQDPVCMFEELVSSKNVVGAQHIAAYLLLVNEQDGITYRNPRIKALTE